MEEMPIQLSKKAQQAARMMPPESPKEPMEYLSRTWSVSALEVCKALSSSSSSSSSSSYSSLPPPHHHRATSKSGLNNNNNNNNATSSFCPTPTMRESFFSEDDILAAANSAALSSGTNHFSFNSSATSQLVLERIMSQSEVSPLTSGRLSHSSGPLNGTESPPIPSSNSDDFDDIVKYFRSHNTLQPLFTGGRSSSGTGATTPAGAKTVGRWLKDRKEKKKEEARAHNAQLHAAISVASVAAAVAAFAAAAASATSGKADDPSAKTDMAVASAATLVAAQCVEAAEAMGAEREQLASVVSSAVNVRSHDDITTLTAAAATALRGAATLKARAMKEVWNIAAVLPVEKGMGSCVKGNTETPNMNCSGEIIVPEKDFLGVCIKEYLAKGNELLKRTRKGDLHWKIVSVYINRTGQVILKMKSRHVGNTITKKKKNVVLEVCKDLPAWPGRHLFEGGEQRRYFGLKTSIRGTVEFECKSRREYEIWTQGVSSLLSIAAERRRNPHYEVNK